jgi:hypothetical protein
MKCQMVSVLCTICTQGALKKKYIYKAVFDNELNLRKWTDTVADLIILEKK